MRSARAGGAGAIGGGVVGAATGGGVVGAAAAFATAIPDAMFLIRCTTSSVKPCSSTSIHVFVSPSIGDALSTVPSIATTTSFGSSRPRVTEPPGVAANGTFIESSFPLRSLRE